MRRVKLVALMGLPIGFVVSPVGGIRAQQTVVPLPVRETSARVVPHAMSNGRGEVRVTPDHAVITAVVETRSDSAGAAATENTHQYNALVQALRAAGVDAAQISSPGYTVAAAPIGYSGVGFAVASDTYMSITNGTPGATRPPARRPSTLARRSVRVDMVRSTDIDRVVAAAIAGGGTQLGVQFEALSLVSAQQAALVAAVQDARANADAMARGAGGTLGQLVDLNTSYSPFGGLVSYATTTSYETSPFSAMATPAVIRDLTVVATVTARWEIVMPVGKVP